MTGVGIIHQLEEARRSRVPSGEVISLYRVNTNKSHKPVKITIIDCRLAKIRDS